MTRETGRGLVISNVEVALKLLVDVVFVMCICIYVYVCVCMHVRVCSSA